MNYSDRIKKMEKIVGVNFGVLNDEQAMNAMSETARACVILRSLTQVLPENEREEAGDVLCRVLSEQRGIKTNAETKEAFMGAISKLPVSMQAPLEAVVSRFLEAAVAA